MKSKKMSRRDFITKSSLITAGATAGMSALASPTVLGANEKIRVGFIGVGNRGTQLLEMFMLSPDVEVAALCDVYEPYINRDRSAVNKRYLVTGKVPQMDVQFDKNVRLYKDFRKLLEQNNRMIYNIQRLFAEIRSIFWPCSGATN